jgi:hypothetical protein
MASYQWIIYFKMERQKEKEFASKLYSAEKGLLKYALAKIC